jgi:hypothetical protein
MLDSRDTATRKTLISCRIFEDELQASLPEEDDWEIIWIGAGLHTDPEALHRELERFLSGLDGKSADHHILFGSGCHPEIHRLAIRFGASLTGVKNCLEAFCGDRTAGTRSEPCHDHDAGVDSSLAGDHGSAGLGRTGCPHEYGPF